MTNEQLAAYLLSIVDGLNIAIEKVMDNLPKELAVTQKVFLGEGTYDTYPVLDPILDIKESLYVQVEALQGIRRH